MDTQLVLLDPDPDQWKLDDRTRELGRAGVVRARQAIREAARRAAERQRAQGAA